MAGDETQCAASSLDPPLQDEVSGLIRAWSTGDEAALEKLASIVDGELRRLARQYLRGEHPNSILQTTALVNEAYLRLLDRSCRRPEDRTHFFAMSARLMRRILVDHARKRNLKRGAGVLHIPIEEAAAAGLGRHSDFVALDDAMDALAQFDPRKARVVELRFFGGLSVDEIAEVLKISPVTVTRDWNTARAWLYCEISGSPPNVVRA